MLAMVRVEAPGDSTLVPGQLIDRRRLAGVNAAVLAQGGEAVRAHQVLLGITRSARNSDSFLAAASFKETTGVLTEAALAGRTDAALGMKEQIILGGLIPAGTGWERRQRVAGSRALERMQPTRNLPSHVQVLGRNGHLLQDLLGPAT
jgi:DNA-directed RNA polymerase subunit beta'